MDGGRGAEPPKIPEPKTNPVLRCDRPTRFESRLPRLLNHFESQILIHPALYHRLFRHTELWVKEVKIKLRQRQVQFHGIGFTLRVFKLNPNTNERILGFWSLHFKANLERSFIELRIAFVAQLHL